VSDGDDDMDDVPEEHGNVDLSNADDDMDNGPVVGHADLHSSFLQADDAKTSSNDLQEEEGRSADTEEQTKGNPPTPDSGSVTAAAQRLLQKAGNSAALTNTLKDGDKVCILARRSTGRVFERTFDLPTFKPASPTVVAPAGSKRQRKKQRQQLRQQQTVTTKGASPADRMLLQFTVTGHGWSGSTEQCGEFCHAVYHLNVNGVNTHNITEWRDDCERNPVSDQSGTWEIHRDGWCPGSVEPGLYLDMTEWLKNGQNTISVDLSVWSSTENKYEKYTNYGNYIGGGDGAVLFVGATLFIYDGEAVDAIRSQGKAYTAAEMALRTGNSAPSALKPAQEVMSKFGSLLQIIAETSGKSEARSNLSRVTGLQQPTAYRRANHEETQQKKHLRAQAEAKHLSFLQQGTDSRYNFEAKAPWYNFKSESESQWLGGTKVVPAFTNGLIQINSREIRVKVKKASLPEDWQHAAVHFKLLKPDGESMAMDDWDRMGSLGIVFEENAASTKDPASRVKLKPSTGKQLTKSWKLGRLTDQ